MFKALLKKMAEIFSVVFVLVAIIYATVNVLVYDVKAVEAFLASFLFWCVDCQGISACVLHWYRPTADKIAEGIRLGHLVVHSKKKSPWRMVLLVFWAYSVSGSVVISGRQPRLGLLLCTSLWVSVTC